MNTLNESSLYDFFSWGIESLHPDAVALLKVRQNPRGDLALLNPYYNLFQTLDDIIKMAKHLMHCIMLPQQP